MISLQDSVSREEEEKTEYQNVKEVKSFLGPRALLDTYEGLPIFRASNSRTENHKREHENVKNVPGK